MSKQKKRIISIAAVAIIFLSLSYLLHGFLFRSSPDEPEEAPAQQQAPKKLLPRPDGQQFQFI